MASRDRPGREAKKKPKDRSAAPKVQPMAEPPMKSMPRLKPFVKAEPMAPIEIRIEKMIA